jgi:hypothetical protein
MCEREETVPTQEKNRGKFSPGDWHVEPGGTMMRNGERLIVSNLGKLSNGVEVIRTIARTFDYAPDEETVANACLMAAAPRMFKTLGQVYDSVFEPDKWSQNVRLALQAADGVERHWQSAEKRRDDLRVQRAAPDLLEIARLAVGFFEESGTHVFICHGKAGQSILEKARAAIRKAEGRE